MDTEKLRELVRYTPSISDFPGDHFEDAEPIMVEVTDGEYVKLADVERILAAQPQKAELGQEVGEEQAPAWFYVRTPGADYDYTFTKTREEAIDLQDCDEPDEPIPLYTSPAHTSEARDAELLKAAKVMRHLLEHIDNSFPPGWGWERLDNALKDAAMRQEGGTP